MRQTRQTWSHVIIPISFYPQGLAGREEKAHSPYKYLNPTIYITSPEKVPSGKDKENENKRVRVSSFPSFVFLLHSFTTSFLPLHSPFSSHNRHLQSQSLSPTLPYPFSCPRFISLCHALPPHSSKHHIQTKPNLIGQSADLSNPNPLPYDSNK